MSESLYRGISKTDGFWVYGAYCPHGDRGFIVDVGIASVGPIAHTVEVYPESVGQFTGIFDATAWDELPEEERALYLPEQWCGQMVFEGDILEAHYDERFPDDATRTVVVWCNHNHGGKGIGWYVEQKPGFGDPLDKFDSSTNKVIGNIHQHKNLLEEETGWA